MIIRAALPEELERVRAAYADWGYHGGVEPDDAVLVAEEEGRFVGLVRCTRDFGTVMLRGMHVAPDARRQGVGSRLLEAFVTAFGGQECYCVPYAHLVQFYGRQGFAVCAVEAAPRSFETESRNIGRKDSTRY